MKTRKKLLGLLWGLVTITGLSSFNSFAQDASAKAVIWTDPQTQLTWTLCPIGVDNDLCTSGKEKGMSWIEAVATAQTAKFGGFDDWRLPTFQELITVAKCVDAAPAGIKVLGDASISPGPYDQAINKALHCSGEGGQSLGLVRFIHGIYASSMDEGTGRTWTTDINPFAKVQRRYAFDVSWMGGKGELISPDDSPTLLVRGGKPSPEWLQAIADAAPKVAVVPPSMWTDPRTQLTWTLCPIGVDGNLCTPDSSPARLVWTEAVAAAKNAKFGGFDDWRLPTIQELTSILKCVDFFHPENIRGEVVIELNPYNRAIHCRGIKGSEVKFTNGIYGKRGQGDTWLANRNPTEKDRRRYALSIEWGNGLGSPGSAPALLVRGGKPSPEWSQAVEDASPATQAAIANAREAELHAVQKRQQDQTNAALKRYQAETERLRKSPKPGDKTRQGLIVAVKGELVQLQTYRDECTQMGPSFCLRSQRVPAGLVWMRKTELDASYAN